MKFSRPTTCVALFDASCKFVVAQASSRVEMLLGVNAMESVACKGIFNVQP